ncbi:hypothetical protein PspS04_15820 [Pseudomonas sp. S04]|nr:hypothetical protein PspS04_15820 [Pseudomonas sp. S04]QHF34220.1 hypothetical protein PspS19_15825 [Pseudomonas sp. S19]
MTWGHLWEGWLAEPHRVWCMQGPVGAGLPAMVARTARCIRLCALSLATIASLLAMTVYDGAQYRT